MTATPTDLDALAALEKAATPGPWRAHDTWLTYGGMTATVLAGEGSDALRAWLPSFSHDPAGLMQRNVWNDAAFIAAARNQMLALLDELAKTRAELSRLRDRLPMVREELANARAELEQITGVAKAQRNAVMTLCAMNPDVDLDTLRRIREVYDANPATTAEPADEDELVPHVEHISRAEYDAIVAIADAPYRPELFAPWDDEDATPAQVQP